MSEEEKKLFRLYGKLPTHKNVLMKVQKARSPFHALLSNSRSLDYSNNVDVGSQILRLGRLCSLQGRRRTPEHRWYSNPKPREVRAHLYLSFELCLIACLYPGFSIPHASPPAQAGHPALSTSTSGIVASSTSPIRESPLAPHSHRRTSSAEREPKGETDKPAATAGEQTSSEPIVEQGKEEDVSAESP